MSTPARLISILLGAALGLQTLALGLHAHQHDATSESPTCAHSCGGSHATPTDDDRTTPPPTDDGDSCLICLLALQGFKTTTLSIDAPALTSPRVAAAPLVLVERAASHRPLTAAHPRAPPA